MPSKLYAEIPGYAYVRLRFACEGGLVDESIKIISRSPEATHVEFITPTGTTIGARCTDGIRERPINYFKPKWERRYSIPCFPSTADRVMVNARTAIGTKYDYLDILGLAFEDTLHDGKRAICSEFVNSVMDKSFLYMLNALPTRSYRITPELLHLSRVLMGHCTFELGV